MRKLLLAPLMALAALPAARADYVATFDDLGLPPGYNSANFPGGNFTSGGFTFTNVSDQFGFSRGWVPSNSTDTSASPPDYSHEFGAITGTGSGGSAAYGILYDGHTAPGSNGTYTDGLPGGTYVDLPAGSTPKSIDLTNSTYTYDSITQGDGFATKFAPGDFLKVDIIGYSGKDGAGSVVGDKLVTLADFPIPPPGGTSSLSAVTAWTTVPLGALAGAQSLGFRFTVAPDEVDPALGIKVPLFVAADNLTATPAAVPEPSSLVLGLIGAGLVRMIRRRGRTNLTCVEAVR